MAYDSNLMQHILLSFVVGTGLALAGCSDLPASYTPPEECVGNDAPTINNLELNSWQDELSGLWTMCLHFDWRDPGSGSSAPNMIGGYVSTEVRGFRAESQWLDSEVIPDPAATLGQLNIVFCQEEWAQDTFIDFEMRVRDSCGAASPAKSGKYCLGQGLCDYTIAPRPHVLENPEVGGDGCQVRTPCPPSEEPPAGEGA